MGIDDDLLEKAKYTKREKKGGKWIYTYAETGKGGGRNFKSEADLNKMSELEVSKYSNDLRMKRNSLAGEAKKEIQVQIDLTDKIRAEKKTSGATKVTSENVSTEKVKEALSNKQGISFSDDPKVRSAMKEGVHNILTKLQGKK